MHSISIVSQVWSWIWSAINASAPTLRLWFGLGHMVWYSTPSLKRKDHDRNHLSLESSIEKGIAWVANLEEKNH